MDTKVDLSAASGEALLDIIDQQQAVIDQLQRRIEVLEGKAKPADPRECRAISQSQGGGQRRKKGPGSPGPKALPAIG
jgi:hypothetical protein